uniref:Oxidoreductase n=1 Tax=Magnetospirillum gryphiswaldense TaxID=55518 RepID=A4TY90_9PROT|nr:oxidoreductase [Magnetospirillum gryphiswaldense MSR-1]
MAKKGGSLASHDGVILALPPWALSPLLPEQDNFDTETIANVHFRLPHAHALPHPLGLIGGMGQWLFVRGDVASVTLSAAQATPDAAILWREIAPVLDLPIPTPPHRVVQEKRATLRHTPSSSRRRPGPTTGRDGVFLAGDWLASPWPCTMESAISSGLAAARLALGRDDLRFS